MNLEPLPRLEFFDLPVFYKHLDEIYRDRKHEDDTDHRTLNSVYVALEQINWDAQQRRLADLYNNKKYKDGYYYAQDNRILEYFYTELVSTDWVDDVREHIAQLQQKVS